MKTEANIAPANAGGNTSGIPNELLEAAFGGYGEGAVEHFTKHFAQVIANSKYPNITRVKTVHRLKALANLEALANEESRR